MAEHFAACRSSCRRVPISPPISVTISPYPQWPWDRQIADIDRQQIHGRVPAPESGSRASRPRKCRSRSRAAPYRARRSSAAGDRLCSRTRICALTDRFFAPAGRARSAAHAHPEFARQQPLGPTRKSCRRSPFQRGPYFGFGPGRGLSAKPAKPSRANRPRHVLTVCGIFLSVRAIERVECPSPAIKTIGARKASRCSVLGARNRASNTARSARAQQHVTCVGKEAAESSELCLDGLDRQEPLSQYAQALQSALAAQQISDMAVQTLAHEKFDPQDPPEPAIGPVLQLVRSAFSGLLNSMTRRGPKKGTL